MGRFDYDYIYVDDTESLKDVNVDENLLICEPTSTFKAQIGMEKWCNDNCNHVPQNCPASMCQCKSDSDTSISNDVNTEEETLICKPTNPFRYVPGMSKWCDDNCNGATKYCPDTYCTCT